MVFKDILLVILGQLSSVTVFRLLFLPVSSVLVLWVLIWLSVLCLESLCKRLVTLSDYRPFCLRALIGEHESVCVCVCMCVCSISIQPGKSHWICCQALCCCSMKGSWGFWVWVWVVSREVFKGIRVIWLQTCIAFLCTTQALKRDLNMISVWLLFQALWQWVGEYYFAVLQ